MPIFDHILSHYINIIQLLENLCFLYTVRLIELHKCIGHEVGWVTQLSIRILDAL